MDEEAIGDDAWPETALRALAASVIDDDDGEPSVVVGGLDDDDEDACLEVEAKS